MLLLLVGSEVLLVHWLLLASSGSGLGLSSAASTVVALITLNIGSMFLLMRLARRTNSFFVLSRVWLLASLAAVFSGPPLLASFAFVGSLAWLTQSLGEGATGQAALVGSGGAAIAIGFGSILWGYFVGQRRVEVERVELPMLDLPAALSGVRVAHITDLHIGPQLRAPQLAGFVAQVNELEAEIIVITGDLFDFDPAFIEEGCRELAHLRATFGVFAVLGNHDAYTGAEAVAEGIARYTNIQLLRDGWERIEIDDAELVIAGIEDSGEGWTEREFETPEMERLADEIPTEIPRLLLIHRPSLFGQASRLGFPVSLAGHTHGGQISFPPPAHHHNISRLISYWTRGLFEDETGDCLLYVNRGLGVSGPPVRLNCAREIALHRLVSRRR